MSRQANPVAIGGFVLGAVVIIVASILIFGSGAWFTTKSRVVSYFPGSVQGLTVGAAVQFRGVQVGQVTGIKLDYYVDESRFSAPVYYEVWPDSFRARGGELKVGKEARGERTKLLVEKYGLRAQLVSQSLVTGEFAVELALKPDTKFDYVGSDPDVTEIPAIESAVDKIKGMLEGLDLKKLTNTAISALHHFDELMRDPKLKELAGKADDTLAEAKKTLESIEAVIDPTVKQLDTTLADYSELAKTAGARVNSMADRIEDAASAVATLSRNVDKEVKPVSKSVTGALNEARKTFDSIDDMVAPNSATRTDLDTMLEEAAGAARSLRLLADYIEQHPDALIKGKN